MKLLLHTCCAPCLSGCAETLKNENIKPEIFWFNPNIHPFTEYKNRKTALETYCESISLNLILKDVYGLREFIKNIYPDFKNRCKHCYKTRLEETAKFAAENNFNSFSTTLLASPYQNHELICEIAYEKSKKYDVKFFYKDFRENFKESQKKFRETRLFMQKYCGCIFSEEERYLKN